MSDAPKTGTGFLIALFGVDFWQPTCVVGIQLVFLGVVSGVSLVQVRLKSRDKKKLVVTPRCVVILLRPSRVVDDTERPTTVYDIRLSPSHITQARFVVVCSCRLVNFYYEQLRGHYSLPLKILQNLKDYIKGQNSHAWLLFSVITSHPHPHVGPGAVLEYAQTVPCRMAQKAT